MSSHDGLVGFALTHTLLRLELPRIAAALAGGPMTRGQEAVVEGHLRLVTDHLMRHHEEEDEFHWPLLVSRAPEAAALLANLEAEHLEMDPLVARVRDRGLSRPDRSASMARLVALVLNHLDAEDRSVLPLLAAHVTPEEQQMSTARSRAKIPQVEELRVLAMMLAAATEDQRTHMLAPLPAAMVQTWSEREAPALDRVHQVLADVADGQPQLAPSATAPDVSVTAGDQHDPGGAGA